MAQLGNTPFNNDSLRISSDIMRALAHPLRLRIVGLLNDKKSASVQLIYTTLGVEQSVASQHLRILRQAGLVLTEREGKFVYYLLNDERLEKAGVVSVKLAALERKPATRKKPR